MRSQISAVAAELSPKRLSRLPLAVLLLLPLWPLLACDEKPLQQTIGPAAKDAPPAVAAQVDAGRFGKWRGGPEPAGKVRSGIISFYQFEPTQPVAGQSLNVTLRLEEVVGSDAKIDIALERVQWSSEQPGQSAWRLLTGRPSQLTLKLIPPDGDAYLHLMTMQNGRSSTRSILIATGGTTPKAELVGQTYELDARGEPIVRSRAAP